MKVHAPVTRLTLGASGLAILILALTILPAEFWRAPTDDAAYHGFDSNLMYSSGGSSGSVRVTANSTDIVARPGAQPSISLATTLMPKITASVDVTVMENRGADEPLRIGLWSPWTNAGRFVLFGSGPENMITVETIVNGGAGTTLIGGHLASATVLGAYELGRSYRVVFVLDRKNGWITSSVRQGGGTQTSLVTSRQAPSLFSKSQMSLTASISSGNGQSHVILQNFNLVLPHQRWWAVKVDDPVEWVIVILLAGIGLALMGIAFIGAAPALRRRLPDMSLRVRRPSRGALLVAIAVAAYFAGNAALFPLGGHPFDSRNEVLYAYVTRTHGLVDLYYLPNTVSLARIWGGVPYVEAAFPYGPVFGYLESVIGWLGSFLFAGGGIFNLGDVRLLFLVKSVNVVFGLADAGLIYSIVRRTGIAQRWSVLAGALFLFNPAVWFSMSVWGQTHVISIFFVLGAVLLAEKQMPVLAWLALAAALMTRPQMIVFGLLLGIVLLRKFTLSQNLHAMSWAVVAAFLLLLPFTLGTSPSLPIDINVNNFIVQEAGGNQAQLSTVSQDAYSIWPLVTYALHGASGLARAFTPSSTDVLGPVTYQRLGLILTVAALLAVSMVLLSRRRSALEAGGYLPLVALGIGSFLMLLTGVVATHFLLALPFLILSRRWMGHLAYLYVVAIWTITTLVPMYGDMGVVISAVDYPLLAPAHNALTRFFVDLYAWDRFITVAIVANICAVIWLAVLAYRPAHPSRVEAAGASA